MEDAGRLLRNNLILIELDIYFDDVWKERNNMFLGNDEEGRTFIKGGMIDVSVRVVFR
jgi:hypothetical protein